MHTEEAEPDVDMTVVVYVHLTFGVPEVVIIMQMIFSRYSVFL